MRIVVDASRQGEVSFAEVVAHNRLERCRRYDTAGIQTFTDCLLRYAGDERFNLAKTRAVIAVSGPVARDTVHIARSRWIFSRSGLGALFERPPLIINDVTARAWTIRDGSHRAEPIVGLAQPFMAHGRRTVLISVDEGVGSAILDISSDGHTTIIATELGHADFAPVSAAELQMGEALRGSCAAASWEQVLTAPAPGVVPADARHRSRERLLAGMFGRFVADAILSAGAWNGVILAGAVAKRIVSGEGVSAFIDALARQRALRRLVSETPCWQFDGELSVLSGCAAAFADPCA